MDQELEQLKIFFPKIYQNAEEAVKIAQEVYPDYDELLPLVLEMYYSAGPRREGQTMEQEMFGYFDEARRLQGKPDVHREKR